MSKAGKKTTQEAVPIPPDVLAACNVQWGALVDAYLIDAAPVGNRYAAVAYLDRSGLIDDGSTVATPPVKEVERRHGFLLLQTLCGNDHYVIATSRLDGVKN